MTPSLTEANLKFDLIGSQAGPVSNGTVGRYKLLGQDLRSTLNLDFLPGS